MTEESPTLEVNGTNGAAGGYADGMHVDATPGAPPGVAADSDAEEDAAALKFSTPKVELAEFAVNFVRGTSLGVSRGTLHTPRVR